MYSENKTTVPATTNNNNTRTASTATLVLTKKPEEEQPQPVENSAVVASPREIFKIPSNEVSRQKEINASRCAKIYKGEWKGQTVAIKEISRGSKEENEAEIMWKLDHPNILKLHGVYYTNSNPYPALVMDFMSYGDLNTLLHNEQNISWVKNERFRIATKIATGLDYLEKINIIHRDMKSDNILVSAKGEITITDFGFAVEYTGEMYLSTESLGSPYWASPEALSANPDGKFEYTPGTDMYGFGNILYSLWSFQIPHANILQVRRVLQRIKQGTHNDIPDDAPAHVKSLIVNLWSLEPKSRYRAADVIPILNPAPSQSSTTVESNTTKTTVSFTAANKKK